MIKLINLRIILIIIFFLRIGYIIYKFNNVYIKDDYISEMRKSKVRDESTLCYHNPDVRGYPFLKRQLSRSGWRRVRKVYLGHSPVPWLGTAVQLASHRHLDANRSQFGAKLNNLERAQVVGRDRGYHSPCSSSLLEPELPSSQELTLFPLDW